MAGRPAPELETFNWPRERGKQPKTRACAHPGCAEPGEHRAPVSRDEMNRYQWFCLDHAREFNKAWNYFEGMNDTEVEADVRRDTTWNRPTWRLGGNGQFRPERFNDPLNVFGAAGMAGDGAQSGPQNGPPVRPPISEDEARAYRTLGLEYPVTAVDLKARYKLLVKEYHPDANLGDRTAEDRLKDINAAYRTLKHAVQA